MLRIVLVLAAVGLLVACRQIELPDTKEGLLRLMDDEDAEVSVRATEALDRRFGEPALREALEVGGPRGRGLAAQALSGHPTETSKAALLRALDDGESEVRFKAVISLGTICDTDCLTALDALTGDPDERVIIFRDQAVQQIRRRAAGK